MAARGFTLDRNATLEEGSPPTPVEAVSRQVATKINGGRTISQGDEVLGRLIAVRRAALGLSQEDLAARLKTSKAHVTGIENGLPPSLETLERLAAELAAEPRKAPAWRSLRGPWRWGGVAVAFLVPALLILTGRSGETDRGASSEPLPESAPPAPAAPAPVVQVDTQGTPQSETQAQRETKAENTKGAAPRPERDAAGGEEPRQSPPESTLGATSPAKPAPSPPADAGSPQPPESGSPSPPPEQPPKPTGKPEDTPGNGPGGGGSAPGNGPGGTGPPGQLP
jgi:transcriptional regulator with XRE-family HTH domain